MALPPNELHRTLGVSNKSAWFMCHRIRETMKQEPLAAMLSGTVVVDETVIGGSEMNRHKKVVTEPSASSPAGENRNREAEATRQ